MRIPDELMNLIEELVSGIPLSRLVTGSKELFSAYHSSKLSRGISMLSSENQRLAYLCVRLPATYAVIRRVLIEGLSRLEGVSIESMLDVGAGPGTAMWAAIEHSALAVAKLKDVVLYERDPQFIELGKKLAPPLTDCVKHWIPIDITQADQLASKDLVIASYVLGEMQPQDRMRTLIKLWKATQKVLVIIEPGTPKGFEEIRAMRAYLIGQGAHLIAPCPHALSCPIVKPDWCHFYARVERSSLHRQIKGGTLNFEDEKFSYLVFGRQKGSVVRSRILSQPQKQSGCVSLSLCGPQGIQQISITKKMKEDYKRARKASWGDPF